MHDDRHSFLELRGGLEPSQHRDYKSRPLPIVISELMVAAVGFEPTISDL